MEKEFDEHFKSWLSGFIDGEGCFVIYPKKTDNGIAIRLDIATRIDDLNVIRKIQKYLGGKYNFHYYKEGNKKPQVILHIDGAKGCLRIIRHLDKYPLVAKKKEDYKIWREAVLLVASREHLKGKRPYLLYLSDKLKQIRKFNQTEEISPPEDKQFGLEI